MTDNIDTDTMTKQDRRGYARQNDTEIDGLANQEKDFEKFRVEEVN